MTVIKNLSVSLKTFEIREIEIEAIDKKMRRIVEVHGVPPKTLKSEMNLVRFRVGHDLHKMKEEFPQGKLLGEVILDSELPLYIYRIEK